MFKLTENNLVKNNRCKYTDEYGNTVSIFRTEEGFKARLRFANKGIAAKPNYITLEELCNGDNINFKVDITKDKEISLEEEDVSAAIDGYGEIMDHWGNLILDVALSRVDARAFKGNNPELTDEEISELKLKSLMDYEELRPSIDCIDAMSQLNAQL